ncbi:MAG: hypothetical protein ACFB9M_06370 [Myxococcota bacterium]
MQNNRWLWACTALVFCGCPGEVEDAETLLAILADQGVVTLPPDLGSAPVTDAGVPGTQDLGVTPDLGQPDAGGAMDPCPQFVDIGQELITPECGTAACHDADNPQANLDLVSAGVAQRVVDVTDRSGNCVLVDSSDPDSSLMLSILTSSPPCSIQMPFLGTPFTADQTACVAAWVDELVLEVNP